MNDTTIVPPMTAEERAVLTLLMGAMGASRAVSINAIREQTGMSYRAVTVAVESLRTTHRLPIGSARGEPHGYFHIVSADDLETTVRPLKHQALSMLRVVSSLEGRSKSRLRELLGQVEFELPTGTAAEPCMARIVGTQSILPLHREDSEACWHCHGVGECGCAACAPGWAAGPNACCSCRGTGRVAWAGRAGRISGGEAVETGLPPSVKKRSWAQFSTSLRSWNESS